MQWSEDNRGVSQVVGFILIFALLVILLTLYQTQIVPPNNAQTEYQHSQTVQQDMLELRNGFLTADRTGNTQFQTVKLGTEYQPRTFALNPPASVGTLETSEARPITILDSDGNDVSNVCPAGTNLETRSLTYEPSYYEYDGAPEIVYENSLLYLEFDDNRTLPLTSQQLVQSGGDVIDLAPLNTSYQRSSSRAVNMEIVPGLVNTVEVADGTVTTPTNLSESTWENLLADQLSPGNVSVTNGNLTLDTSGTVRIACSPVGLDQAPDGGARDRANLDINPTDSVQIRNITRPSNDVIDVVFNNTAGEDANATEARLTFYNNPDDTGGDIGPIDVIDPSTGATAASLEQLEPFQTLDPQLSFPGNGTETTITFENTGGEKFASRDYFVLDVKFSNGQRATYFVDVPA